MKISPISNVNAAYAAFSGNGQGGSGQFLQSAFDGSSQPVDSVHLSSTAQAHLSASDAVNSDFDSISSDTGCASLR
jgi:hypothetical protein